MMTVDHGTYQQAYFDAVNAIHETELVAVAASDALRDFPRRLPADVQVNLFSVIADARNAIASAEDTRSSTPLESEFASTALMTLLTRSLAGAPADTIDFGRLLASQRLAMTLAHLDAFIGVTVRVMCQVRPESLRRNKQVTWEQVISAGSWETLLEHLIEVYAFEFGWKTLVDKLEALRSVHGVEIDFPQTDIDLLIEAEQLRHLVIHNGGRVSAEYIRRSRTPGLRIGQLAPFEPGFIVHTGRVAVLLCSEVFDAVSVKYFFVPRGSVTGVFRRGSPESEAG